MPPCSPFLTRHRSRDRRTGFRICRPVMDPLLLMATMHQGSRCRKGTSSPTLCAATRHLRRTASAPPTPTAQEASGRGACAQLLHGTRVRRGAFPCATPQRGNTSPGRDRDTWFEREVRPHVPDAWMSRSKDKIGHGFSFNWHFYKYTPPRPLEEISADLKDTEAEIMHFLWEMTG